MDSPQSSPRPLEYFFPIELTSDEDTHSHYHLLWIIYYGRCYGDDGSSGNELSARNIFIIPLFDSPRPTPHAQLAQCR